MTALLLVLQFFAFPITSAYAVQVKSNVVVSVTYIDIMPTSACVSTYALDDVEMTAPLDTHCWKPTNSIGEFDTWENERIDMVNFKVVVRYPNRPPVEIALVMKLNT